jgi:hypothetical protein
MYISAVRLPGPLGLVAYVFRGDSDDRSRVWNCVRSKMPSLTRAWLGCWSSKGAVSSRQVESSLIDLSARIGEGARRGPHGPHLGGYHFIPEWESWGIGNPKPIVDLPLGEADLSSLDEMAVEDFTFES